MYIHTYIHIYIYAYTYIFVRAHPVSITRFPSLVDSVNKWIPRNS